MPKAAPFLSHYGSVEICVEPNIEILAQIVVCAKSLKNSFLIKILYSTAKNVSQYSYTGINDFGHKKTPVKSRRVLCKLSLYIVMGIRDMKLFLIMKKFFII